MATQVHTRRKRVPILHRRARTAANRSGHRVRDFLEARPWWQTALLVIGFVTVVTVFGVLILGLDDKPDQVRLSTEVGSIGSKEFLSTVSRTVGAPVETGGEVLLLDNGDEFLPALIESIRQARQTINFSVFMWDDGTFSDRVLAALLERQQHGVAVRVLLDTMGAIAARDSAFAPLQAAGGRVAKFRMPAVGSWTRVHRRNHRRENVFGVLDERLGQELERMFAADLERSKEVRLNIWRTRNVFGRFLEWISTILDEQS